MLFIGDFSLIFLCILIIFRLYDFSDFDNRPFQGALQLGLRMVWLAFG